MSPPVGWSPSQTVDARGCACALLTSLPFMQTMHYFPHKLFQDWKSTGPFFLHIHLDGVSGESIVTPARRHRAGRVALSVVKFNLTPFMLFLISLISQHEFLRRLLGQIHLPDEFFNWIVCPHGRGRLFDAAHLFHPDIVFVFVRFNEILFWKARNGLFLSLTLCSSVAFWYS